LKDHLGNIRAVVSDVKLWVSADAIYDGIAENETDVLAFTDYYSFGSTMPGRNYINGSSYRYGMNGKEKDDEIVGSGNSYDFGARQYDPRLGRFIALDPKMSEYASMSPYCFAANNPIKLIDVNGEGPGEEKPLTIPTSPDKVDTKVWTPVEEGTGANRGHTQRWTNAEGQMLAFDKGKEGAKGWEGKDHFHVYNKDGQRLQANGELAGGVKDGKAFYNKSAANAHFTPGETTKIKIKIPSAAAVMEGSTKVVKFANKAIVPVAIAGSVYDIATSDNKAKAFAKNAGGWAGAYMGAETGAAAGAAVGAFFGGVGAIPGAAIGGLIGGIGGWFAGESAGEATYDLINKK
jgi:RHS repeat-associated protein